MAEPLTLALVGGVVLTEGIKFLYAQAGEALKRWQARKQQSGEKPATEEVPIAKPASAGTLQGNLSTPLVLDHAKLDQLAETMTTLRRELGDYADGTFEVPQADQQVLKSVNMLRNELETVFGQRITLTGENRPASGTPVVIGEAEVRELEGRAAGVIADTIRSGEVRGSVKADHVGPGGEAAGVHAKDIGGS